MRVLGLICGALVCVALGCGAGRTAQVAEAARPTEIAIGSKVGERAPLFALPDSAGETVRLEAYRGKPTVLVFYRGEW